MDTSALVPLPAAEDAPNTVSALRRKYAELAGILEALALRREETMDQLAAVDATLRLFDPEADTATIRPKLARARVESFTGDMTRFVLRTMRVAGEAMTCRDIAAEAGKTNGVDPDDHAMALLLSKRAYQCLYKLQRRGIVRKAGLMGGVQGWEITPLPARR